MHQWRGLQSSINISCHRNNCFHFLSLKLFRSSAILLLKWLFYLAFLMAWKVCAGEISWWLEKSQWFLLVSLLFISLLIISNFFSGDFYQCTFNVHYQLYISVYLSIVHSLVQSSWCCLFPGGHGWNNSSLLGLTVPTIAIASWHNRVV